MSPDKYTSTQKIIVLYGAEKYLGTLYKILEFILGLLNVICNRETWLNSCERIPSAITLLTHVLPLLHLLFPAYDLG